MQIYSILSSVMTVVSFIVFIGIVAWAYSRHRREPYREAANAPFELPDEIESADRKVSP